jgi:two-component system OmpR family response regulator
MDGSDGPRILVVDDEENIRFLLRAAFRHEGFDVETSESGLGVAPLVSSFRPDVIVLDVMLPDVDGFELCRRLRDDGVTAPVIFLTARSSTDEKVRGLGLGDDYVTKPFSLEEVTARVRVALRRAGVHLGSIGRLAYADVEMDELAHRVTRGGAALDLSPTEFRLLRLFLLNPDRVLTRTQILDLVWEYDFGGNANVVETYVSYLRKKLDPLGPPLLQTIRGVGYALRQA